MFSIVSLSHYRCGTSAGQKRDRIKAKVKRQKAKRSLGLKRVGKKALWFQQIPTFCRDLASKYLNAERFRIVLAL
jgi:hypothetical protein